MAVEFLRSRRRIVESVLVIALLLFLGWYAYGRWQEAEVAQLSFSIPYLLVALTLLLSFYALLSFTWQKMLRMIQAYPPEAGRNSLHRVLLLAFVTRYLPGGKLWIIGSRIELFGRLGGSRSQGLESVYYEQLYLTVGAFLLGLASFPAAGEQILPLGWWNQFSWLIAGLALVGTLAVAFGAEQALRVAVKLLGQDRLSHLGTRLEMPHKVELILRFLVINALQGGAAYAFLQSIYPATPTDLPMVLIVVAAYPVGRFVGQAAVLLPGGLAVREGAFAFLLSPFLPVKPVLVAAALMRLASILLELALLGITSGLEKLHSAPDIREV